MSGPEVLLVSMPWASIKRPALGLSTLSATLLSSDIPCEVYYPTMDFAKEIGVEAYETLANTPSFFGACEHIFSLSIFDREILDSNAFLGQYNLPDGSNPFESILAEHIEPFLERTAEAILGTGARIVGFGCTFNQTLPSLAVARILKSRDPGRSILFGGSSLHGTMGTALASAFPDLIDHVFLGEADNNFLPLIQALRTGKELAAVPGITIDGKPTRPSPPTSDLDALPVPQYDDYMRQLSISGFPDGFVEAIPFESSRGCWWGQKSHCTFCGLNSEGIAYRRKSDERILSEIVELSSSYRTNHLMAADNILPHTAWRKLLPSISDLNLDLNLFYEIKANITRDQVDELRHAGVRWVQPGIESFSTPILKLMRKGISGLQNVKLIRLCQEFGVSLSYNILIGFPGERHSDYLEMRDLLLRIQHLPPPSGKASLVQIHRFSPFHDQMDSFGFTQVRAAGYYGNLIPASVLDPSEYAYFFDRFVPPEVERHLEIINDVVKDWLCSSHRITARLGAGFVEITDSRDGRTALDPCQSALLLAADEVRKRDHLFELMAPMGKREDDLVSLLAEMVDRNWIVSDGESFVGAIPFARAHSSRDLSDWSARWLPQSLLREAQPVQA